MQEHDLEEALRRMQRRYGCRLAAATLGEDGVLAWDGKQPALTHRPIGYRWSIRPGAGDTFHAGFIYGLLQGWPLDRQLDFACAAGGVELYGGGARGGIRSVETIEELMATGTHYPAACYVPSYD